ncbi:MAG: MarR family transcriptional regulator, partial [Lachnospiraceae bacterium]|nr:MarR family transcriptional regulator [Lachnospiraceae bacterium]
QCNKRREVDRVADRERQIGFQVKAINNMIRRKLDIRFAEAGLEEISGMQGPLLGYLDRNSQERDIFQKDLEKQFNIRRSTATVMLQNLEQKGYIVRESVDSDARLKRIVLTQKAIEVNQEVRKQIDAFNEELEQGLTTEEKELFLQISDKIIRNLE